jgi:hypothetical protein
MWKGGNSVFYSGYNRLFWGYIFVIFNFNIGALNIFPDFIGYIIILTGLNILSEQNRHYEKGKIPAGLLIFLSLMGLFKLDALTLESGIVAWNLAFMLAGSIQSIINMYLVYCICKGIYEVAAERGMEELKSSVKWTFKWFFSAEVFLVFYTPFSLNLSKQTQEFMVIIFIVNLFVLIALAALLRRSRNQLGE